MPRMLQLLHKQHYFFFSKYCFIGLQSWNIQVHTHTKLQNSMSVRVVIYFSLWLCLSGLKDLIMSGCSSSSLSGLSSQSIPCLRTLDLCWAESIKDSQLKDLIAPSGQLHAQPLVAHVKTKSSVVLSFQDEPAWNKENRAKDRLMFLAEFNQ